ncbi:ATP-binding protein [Streptomyces sp. NPDC093225]|uniref:ATP-binding protein n=1 Tax=Streptomyces sp. NPDC093225 TaxID=3366034 RepID=UPI0038155EDD
MAPRVGDSLTCERARDVTRTVLAARGVSEADTGDALLVVTELVANARRHAGGATALRVTCRPPTVEIEVSDDSPEQPVERPSRSDEPGRFGWAVINRIAERVTTAIRSGGKTISVVVAARTGTGPDPIGPASAGTAASETGRPATAGPAGAQPPALAAAHPTDDRKQQAHG